MFRTTAVAMLLLLAMFAHARAETRVALVVGNSSYQHTSPLPNPKNDARDVAAALKSAGFEVIETLDADKAKLDAALRTFTEKLAGADVALFFYAGHGLQLGLQNFLVPIDAKLERERDLEFEAMKLEFVLRQMEIEREGKISIVVLDACRDNPLARNLARSMGTRSAAVGRGLAAAATGLGTFIAYSTQPGNVALDGTGRNSPFTAALVKQIAAKGRNLPATMIEVRKEVVAATDGAQVPWDHSAMTGEFFFLPAETTPGAGSIAAAPAATPDDVAALKERLHKLEEEAKSRNAPAPSVTTSPQSQGDAVQARIPPVVAKSTLQKDSPDFDLAENVALSGAPIRSFRAPSPAACRDACQRDTACVGYQHGKKIGVMGTCELYAKVDARNEDARWRSGMRKTSSGGATAAAKLQVSTAVLRSKQGFDYYEGTLVDGDVIKDSTTDSADGCMIVCRNTPGCVAAQWDVVGSWFSGRSNCVAYRSYTGVSPAHQSSATAIVRSAQ